MLYFGRLLCGAGFGLVSSPAGVGTYLSLAEFLRETGQKAHLDWGWSKVMSMALIVQILNWWVCDLSSSLRSYDVYIYWNQEWKVSFDQEKGSVLRTIEENETV